jgi:hypothetical protein
MTYPEVLALVFEGIEETTYGASRMRLAMEKGLKLGYYYGLEEGIKRGSASQPGSSQIASGADTPVDQDR